MTPNTQTLDTATHSANQQRFTYSHAIGNGSDKSTIEELRTFAERAPVHPRFEQYAEIRFVYEMLSMAGSVTKVSALVDAWVNVRGSCPSNDPCVLTICQTEENVSRAARHVNRQCADTGQALVRAFCVFRLKALDGPKWEYLDDHGAHDDDDENDDVGEPRPQTVVFIALTPLNQRNGFFIDLEPGQDVCVNSNAGLWFPPPGGGLGICLCLNL